MDALYWLMTAVITRQIGGDDESIRKDLDYALRALDRVTTEEKRLEKVKEILNAD